MKAIGKGILVVLVTLGLFALSLRVKAGTMDELGAILGDTPAIYQGSCYFTEEGKLTFSHEEMKVSVPCVVGMKLPDNTQDHYVLVFNPETGTPQALVVYHEVTKTQETLWTASP